MESLIVVNVVNSREHVLKVAHAQLELLFS